MIKQQVTIEDVCTLLNELLEKDYQCIHDLVSNRAVCNEEIADHPSVQVQKFSTDENYTVGLLGILNGLFGADDKSHMGPICMEIQETKIVKFKPTDIK